MKNLHLIPVNIQDIVEKMLDKNTRENEKHNYTLRIEAVRDYCSDALKHMDNKISAVQFGKKGRK